MTTVFLLPGLHGTSELLSPFVAATPPGIRTIAVDYPANESSIDRLECFARASLPDSCVVVAESFSGPIGARLATDRRVRALVLCSSFVSSPSMTALRYLAITPLFALPLPAFVIRTLLSGRAADPTIVTGVQAVIRRLTPTVIAKRVRQAFQANELETVRTLGKPVLYLCGTHDNLMSQRSLKKLLEVRPDTQVVRIAGPHMLLQVSPHECWKAIVKFVETSVAT
jgi:pimeloyl-[acyl-carrier protein] methyl ester esterase